MYFVYNLLLSLTTIFILPVFIAYAFIKGKNREGLKERFGFISHHIAKDPSLKPRLWIHACSVGEVSVIKPIISEIKRVLPCSYIIVSNTTKSGHDLAKQELKDASAYLFFPLDLWCVVKRVLKIASPDIILVSETEIWPNFLKAAKGLGIKTILVNGRISPRSFNGYIKIRPFFKKVLKNFDILSMTSKGDAKRVIAMGAPCERVFINGNTKYDRITDLTHLSFEEEIKEILHVSKEDKVFIAGSTRRGEEEIIIEAYLKFTHIYPDMLLVLAPRHIDRTEEIKELLRQNKLEFVMKTDLDNGKSKRDRKVIIINTIGDLFKIYSIGTIVFCGGSLVPLGGQNILEAAAWGKVVFYGPSMEHFLDSKEILESVGAGIEVKDANDLVNKSLELLKDQGRLYALGKAGREAALAKRGAAKRNAELTRALLEERIIRE
ncbi:MAG: 3-deoxy-D-manno-octulosonic acid transferase [Thermodesulfobacteriota bacterium]|nr:3-deoxy-D-manno-octulosonic acid transferase [Thermodesulfobacteriota bacterium]